MTYYMRLTLKKDPRYSRLVPPHNLLYYEISSYDNGDITYRSLSLNQPSAEASMDSAWNTDDYIIDILTADDYFLDKI